MQSKLNSKKVVEEIDLLLRELNERVEQNKEFDDLHKKSLQLCEIIFQTKKKYENINIPYPNSLVIVFDKAFSEEKIEIPNKEHIKKEKEKLLNEIITILQEAHDIYSMKLRLLEN